MVKLWVRVGGDFSMDERFMIEAINEAKKAMTIDEIPIGAVIVKDGEIIDRFDEKTCASFLRFEKCFGPLFSSEKSDFLVEVFKEICGEKKKYISCK